MSLLADEFLGNPLSGWLIAVAVFVALGMGLQLVRRSAETRLAHTAARTSTDIDDIALHLLRRTRAAFIVAMALYIAAFLLDLPSRIDRVLHFVMVVTLLVQITIWGNAFIDITVSRYTARKLKTADAARVTTVAALGFLGRLVLWSIILLLALDNLGVNITALITGLGITGIAVALAVQNILGDLFASLSIMLDKPFAIGDFIVVDNHMGTVEHIGLKTTRLRSLFGEQIVFSNADLLKSRIHNHKRMIERRVVFTVSLTYENAHTDLLRVPQIVREAIERQQHARCDRVYFKEMRDFALIFEIAYFIDDPNYRVYTDTQAAVNYAIFDAFHREGIEFAHHMTAHTQRLPQAVKG